MQPNPNDLWKDFPVIMRALEPEVMDVIWQAVEPLLIGAPDIATLRSASRQRADRRAADRLARPAEPSVKPIRSGPKNIRP